MKKKILIIGGCGYIGSALFEHLAGKKGERYLDGTGQWRTRWTYHDMFRDGEFAVDTIDLEWFGNHVNPDNLVMDYRHLTAEQVAKYDVVILLAAHSSVPMANNSSLHSTITNNVQNFVDLIGKLREGQKFIYAGSSSVYNGIVDEATEDHTLRAPSNIYDFTKQDIDRLMIMKPNVEYYGLRFGTVNGVSTSLRTDIMINAMVENALQTSEVKLFNEEIRRPILYLHDLVRAIECVIKCPTDKRGVYNLASFNASAGMIAEGVAKVASADLKRVTQTEVEAALKSKLPAVYDFAMSSQKFSETFGFSFSGTIQLITGELVTHFQKLHTSKRIDGKNYV